MDQVDAGHATQEFGRQVRRRAVAGRRVGELIGARLGQRDQFLHRLHRQRRMHNEHAGCRCQQCDRREVAHDVEIEFRIKRRADRVRNRAEEQRVTVGRRLGDDLGADGAAGTRTVIDDQLLAESLAEFLAENARQRLGAAAGREGHDKAQRLVRIIGLRRHCREHRQRSAENDCACRDHASNSTFSLSTAFMRCTESPARWVQMMLSRVSLSACALARPCAMP